MAAVSLFVSCSKLDMAAGSSERRFNLDWSIQTIKERLEAIVGSQPNYMKLELYNKDDHLIARLDDDAAPLGRYPVENYMRLHVVDINPYRQKNDFNDLSKVEKYEIPDEEYDKRTDSVRAFLQKNKLGQYKENTGEGTEGGENSLEEQYKHLAKQLNVGQRCRLIQDPSQNTVEKRGTIMFVGKTEFQKGYWVGIKLDEPLGKNDGSVNGKSYFQTLPKYGVFVRPNAAEVGDFPENNELEEF